LIYLAKLEILEVLSVAVQEALVTPTVLEEATRPQLAYRHPDAVRIEGAAADGLIRVTAPTGEEGARARELASRIAGLHRGEAEVLSVAIGRSIPAVIFERRARRVADSLGARLLDVTELIVAGTRDPVLLEERILRFARMVNLRLDDAMALLERIRSRPSGRSGGER
jgi:predicted nucleic acid-binding protein